MRKLEGKFSFAIEVVAQWTYATMITRADKAAETFQYHRVRSFSLYRSMSVRRGLHLGSEDRLRLGLRIGLLMVGQVGFFNVDAGCRVSHPTGTEKKNHRPI